MKCWMMIFLVMGLLLANAHPPDERRAVTPVPTPTMPQDDGYPPQYGTAVAVSTAAPTITPTPHVADTAVPAETEASGTAVPVYTPVPVDTRPARQGDGFVSRLRR